MLNRALGSGWGVLLPGVILGGLMFADLSIDVWKALIVSGLLVTSGMIGINSCATLCYCRHA